MAEDKNITTTALGREHYPSMAMHEDETAYFERLMDWSEQAKEAAKTHETWKRRHLTGIPESHYRQRILVVLRQLLESDFLRLDWFDTGIPQDEQEQAVEELREQGFGELTEIDGAPWKFALLSQLRTEDRDRIAIDEEHAAFYLNEMHNQLSNDDVEAFFRFVVFTRLVYTELQQRYAEQHDGAVARCMTAMKNDLQPLKTHVTEAFADGFDAMLDEILRVGNLLVKLPQVSPNGFRGGYNQKLTCNLVGVLCHEQVYDITPKEADNLIYTGKTHYTYINSYAGYESSSTVLTRKDVKDIKAVIKKYAT